MKVTTREPGRYSGDAITQVKEYEIQRADWFLVCLLVAGLAGWAWALVGR